MKKAEPTRSLVTATRLAFTAALGGFLFGYDSAVINGAITAIGDHYQWVMLGEKFPNRIRAAALSVSASAQWIANWAITTSFPSLKGAGLGLAYGIRLTLRHNPYQETA